MTLTLRATLFVALAFALPLASAVPREVRLDFILKGSIPHPDIDGAVLPLQYSFDTSTYDVKWTSQVDQRPPIQPVIERNIHRNKRFYIRKEDQAIFFAPPNTFSSEHYTAIAIDMWKPAAEATEIRWTDVETEEGRMYSSIFQSLGAGYLKVGVVYLPPDAQLVMQIEDGTEERAGSRIFPPGMLRACQWSSRLLGAWTVGYRSKEIETAANDGDKVAVYQGAALLFFAVWIFGLSEWFCASCIKLGSAYGEDSSRSAHDE